MALGGRLLRITDLSGASHLFLAFPCQDHPDIDLRQQPLLRDSNASTVVRLLESGHILKLVKPRTFHEYFKLFWNSSRIHKEVAGNLRLKKLGLAVPAIYSHGYGLLPAQKGGFLGFIKMENLAASGYADAREMMTGGLLAGDARQRFLEKFCADLLVMRQHKIVFNDLKLGNTFADAAGNLTWIDTGITVYTASRKAIFASKYAFSLQRFFKRHETLLSVEEKAYIRGRLS
jgi:hypothetical protein